MEFVLNVYNTESRRRLKEQRKKWKILFTSPQKSSSSSSSSLLLKGKKILVLLPTQHSCICCAPMERVSKRADELFSFFHSTTTWQTHRIVCVRTNRRGKIVIIIVIVIFSVCSVVRSFFYIVMLKLNQLVGFDHVLVAELKQFLLKIFHAFSCDDCRI